MKVVVNLLLFILVLTSTQVESVSLRFHPPSSRRHLWGTHKLEGASNTGPPPTLDNNKEFEESVFRLSSRGILQDNNQVASIRPV